MIDKILNTDMFKVLYIMFCREAVFHCDPTTAFHDPGSSIPR